MLYLQEPLAPLLVLLRHALLLQDPPGERRDGGGVRAAVLEEELRRGNSKGNFQPQKQPQYRSQKFHLKRINA